MLHVAIVGVGPRGLSVFERLCANVDRFDPARDIEITLVDSTRVGTGSVWRTDQPAHLLMNTVAAQVSIFTDETVQMQGPVVAGPSLYEWANELRAFDNSAGLPEDMLAEAARLGPDSYPSRALCGHYLRWSFERISGRRGRRVSVREITATATDMWDGPGGLQALELDSGRRIHGLHAVVLTQGHLALSEPGPAELADNAGRVGLTHFPPGNAADVDLDRIPAGEAVIVRGLGLTFFDHLALLTVGRGGRFTETADGPTYMPSGREPLVVAGSRRGVPFHARGENQKGIDGRHEPVLLNSGKIAELRDRARRFGDVSFRGMVWPLIAREVEAVYYAALIRDRTSSRELHRFRQSYLEAPTEREAGAVLARFGVRHGEHWDWDTVADPARGRHYCGPRQFHDWLLAHMAADVRHAQLGNVDGPVKAALDVLRDLRNEVRLVVDHGGITGSSYRDDLDGWYTPLNAFLSIGPPARRIAELAALIRAGTVRIVGPGMQVRVDAETRCFVTESGAVDSSTVTARYLIDAWVPEPHLHRTADPLLRNLLRRSEVRGFTLADPDGAEYATGGLDVIPGSHRLIDGTGRTHPRRHALGVPTEAVRWVTAAGPRPGVNSVTLADSDCLARTILSAGESPRTELSEKGTAMASNDWGLLAPVRAGVPITAVTSDDAWIDAMVDVELALSRAQARAGLIPAGVTEHIAIAVRDHRFDARALAVESRRAANPVVALVARLHDAVAEVDPVSADYVHYGSTSQDILDTATMLIADRALAMITEDLDATVDSLARLARRHRNTPVAARTLAMHAVPTTFGAKVANWMQGLLDARARLVGVRAGLPVQLGGAAGTLASYVECAESAGDGRAQRPPGAIMDRLTDEFAAELSLAVPSAPWHTLRTPIADLAAVLALTSGMLGKFAVDVITLSRTEIAEVAEPAADGRGESSAMPQKHNPVLSTLIRTAALQVPALVSILFGALLAEDERSAGAWHAEWQPLRECLNLVGGAAHTAAELAAGLTADTDRMTDNLAMTGGQLVSERLSTRLSPVLGKTVAKKTLQTACCEAQAQNRPLAEVLASDAQITTHLTVEEIEDLLRAENYLGAAPDLVDRILRRL
ncbi:3-carboxy-cis,cis-muconate cycloisomerase family FAD/NAD(P)-binding protein [Nocardia sp.]|uniref:3-carboxy-cis,cis-muconate cycloisomerase family FAD/NAD(P)-binding protein n=1 Tax=Nocardia sp. TaxID=1821 RepID=UPI002638BA7B|nr:3-carboxy-cis,cis-muconate cycloisomerase family FAD/NAD(P)-binding protein [Nocardia sp.]